MAGMVYATNPSEPIEDNKKTLDFIGSTEGRAILTKKVLNLTEDPTTGDNFRFEYSLKDHLGNLRVSCRCGEPSRDHAGMIIPTGQPGAGIEPLAVVQEQHYDAWGLAFTSTTSVTADRFTYNSKELVADLDLGWNDYGFRMYNNEIGRWSVVDILTEKRYSLNPYNFVSNNPINRIDIIGLSDTLVLDEIIVRAPKREVSNSWNTFIQNLDQEGFNSFKDYYLQVKLGPYTNNFAKTVYGINDAGEVDVPDAILERLYNEVEDEAMDVLAAAFAAEESGIDLNSINFAINPIARTAYLQKLIMTGISNNQAKEIILSIGVSSVLAYGGAIYSSPFIKILKSQGGKIDGFTISTKKGYGAQSRFEVHTITNKKSIEKWFHGKRLPHWHTGKGNQLKKHRPYE